MSIHHPELTAGGLPVFPAPRARHRPDAEIRGHAGRATPPEGGALRLMGLDLFDGTLDAAMARLFDGARRRVAFVNAHCLNVAACDPEYRAALRSADLLLPDGSGVAIAARMQGRRLTANLNGTDLFPHLCAEAARRGLSIYLLGGRPGVVQDAAESARRLAPGLRVAGTRHGYFDVAETDDVIDEINASGADLVFVAMGVPMQDVWLARHGARLSARLSFGVGGLFDFAAGRVRRAPAPVRRAGCEWAWRLAMEPRRLARRYLAGNGAFLARAAGAAALRLSGGAGRALDIVGSAAGLLALSPLLLAIAAAIRLDSRGPAFFVQTRVGRDGVPFRMLKFRSMAVDAEARRAALLASSEREGACFKMRADPRVTRVGRALRRTSLDELPQLINVLKGDMSLVGPRPSLPEEAEAFGAAGAARLRVRPGITGLWQVAGRAEIGLPRMLSLDAAYARGRNPLLDLLLLALTLKAVRSGRGAY